MAREIKKLKYSFCQHNISGEVRNYIISVIFIHVYWISQLLTVARVKTNEINYENTNNRYCKKQKLGPYRREVRGSVLAIPFPRYF